MSSNGDVSSTGDDSEENESQKDVLAPVTSSQSPSHVLKLCLDETIAERMDLRPAIRNKQLQLYLPRTPSSPCPSPFSGPWHGRQTDSSGSSSSSPASSKSSPVSTSPASGKSSPASTPGSAIDQPCVETKLPGITKDLSPPRLTRRHTYPKIILPSEFVNIWKKCAPLALLPPPDPQTDTEQLAEEEVFVRASSLEESVALQQPEMVAYFLEQGCDPNGEKDAKVSPLIVAASAGNEKIVKMLLAAGANIDYEDESKGTALHHAAAGGHRGVLKLLLVAGANMFHKTYEGHLAVQLTNDSRIRHLLTCRMRSSNESPKSDLETAKAVLSQTPVSSRCAMPVPKGQVMPFKIPPLPRNEGFVETTMQRVSPRSESPKNIQRVLEQKKEKESAMQKGKSIEQERTDMHSQKDKPETIPRSSPDDGSSGKAQSSNNKVSTNQLDNHGSSGRKSVQFIEKIQRHEKEPAACKSCAKDDCVGKCQDQPSAEKKQRASTSESLASKLFSRAETHTTGTFKWTKGELLGEGAYGKVFSGLNQSTGELMAVKQLKIDPAEGQEKSFYLSAMEREINLYKKLRHKHIVGYINMEQDEKNGCLYIFLEYVSGGSIQSMLERFGRFSESLVRVYTRQLLLGLQYLHANNIVHRDIKGGNVLVDAVGVVKLADFGASKAFHDPTLTNECKSIRGSVFWMAPEVIKGDGYGRRADIWSVGCTVIEMLTAIHPWPDIDNTWSAIFHIAKASSGPPIPEYASDCVKDFLHQCFQLDPHLRPTASQLLEHRFVAAAE